METECEITVDLRCERSGVAHAGEESTPLDQYPLSSPARLTDWPFLWRLDVTGRMQGCAHDGVLRKTSQRDKWGLVFPSIFSPQQKSPVSGCCGWVVGQFECGRLPPGKRAVPGAYSENGDNCPMQLRRRVQTH